MSILARGATLVSVKRAKRIVVEDPEDDVVLGTALAGGASYLVSGDRHLLDLGKFEGLRIVTVQEMLRILS